jgi:hypothetical protein
MSQNDYFFLSNRMSHLEKLVEELMGRLSDQADSIPAYKDWDEQEICNAHSQCERIIRVHSNIINSQEGME